MYSSVHLTDWILVIVLSPIFVARAFHWVLERFLFKDEQACKSVDSFRAEFSTWLKVVEVRPGRELCILHMVPHTPPRGLLVFVHGACARMHQFEDQFRHFFESGYEVLSYDGLGCGNSKIPVGNELYRSKEFYSDLIAILERFTAERKNVATAVIGHSMGAAMVTRLASSSDCAKYTRSVVSMCNPDFSAKGHSMNVFRLPVSILWLLRPIMGMRARSLLLGPKATARLRAQEKEASARNPVHMFKSFYMGIDPSMFRIKSLGESLTVPTLFIGAEYDKLCPPSCVERVAAHFKRSTNQPQFLLAKGCGHQCMQEDPSQLNKMISEFTERHSRIQLG